MHKVPWDMLAMYQVDDTSNFNANVKHILSNVLPFQSEIKKICSPLYDIFILKICITNLIFITIDLIRQVLDSIVIQLLLMRVYIVRSSFSYQLRYTCIMQTVLGKSMGELCNLLNFMPEWVSCFKIHRKNMLDGHET